MQFASGIRGFGSGRIKSNRAHLKAAATKSIRRIVLVRRQRGRLLRPAPREEAALDGSAGRADGRRQNPAGGGRAAARYDNFSGVSPPLRNFVMIGVTISVTNRRAGSVALGGRLRTSRR